ncbi:MAG: endolytic transglycosylase MltG [Ruminococcus sp.]
MENNNRNNYDELLKMILKETSGEEKREKRSPFKANSTESPAAPVLVQEEPAAPTAEPIAASSEKISHEEPAAEPFALAAPAAEEERQGISAADIFEERTTVHTAARTAEEYTAPAVSGQDDLYDDLDGISQTQIHRKKVSAAAKNGKGKKKKKKKGMRALRSAVLAGVILGVSIILALIIITYGRDILGINNDNTKKIITIPTGADTSEIAEILEKEEIITYPSLFKIFAGLSGKDAYFTAGDHELRPDMAYDTIFENLASPSLGSKDVVDIAFPEGITLVEAAELLEEQEVCNAEEFIDYFNNKSKCGLGYEEYLPSFTNDKFYKMEGYLFPDTYQFYTNMDVDLVCQKILRNFNDKITERDYARMQELGISLDETIIIASMIQREAGSLDQMTRISSVFWNRLNNPEDYPKLQSDPTTGYVEDVIKPHIDSYNKEMFDSYDTYICNGLPAGAICNPGYDAIEAALYPASTDYFYFYSNLNTKETYFSRTLQEHEAWIQKVEGNQYVATTDSVIIMPSGDLNAPTVTQIIESDTETTTTTTEAE